MYNRKNQKKKRNYKHAKLKYKFCRKPKVSPWMHSAQTTKLNLENFTAISFTS